VLEVDQERVLAYRVAAQQYERTVPVAAGLAVLDLGVQDTPYGAARQALAARLADPDAGAGELTLVWSVRGAPHLHRTADLPALAGALWPVSDADATARFVTTRIKAGGALGRDAVRRTAEAIRAVVTAPGTSKAELSAGVTARIPASLSYHCEVCDATHVSGQLLQHAGLAAGIRLTVTGRAATFGPLPKWPGVPAGSTGLSGYVAAYLRLLGPAGPAEVAKYLGTSPAALRPVWPADLLPVTVGGKRLWLPADRERALRTAEAPDVVRLLPPGDPLLAARDRDRLVPDPVRQKEIWRPINSPGTVLAGGAIAGTWKAVKAPKSTLRVTVTPFRPLPARVRTELEAEAVRQAGLRGLANTEFRCG
jgi:hypothetical protein